MNCAEVKQQLEATFDGAAAGESRAAVMEHMGACEGCRAAWDEMRALRSVLRKTADEDALQPSAALDERVMRAFSRAHEPGDEVAAPWWRRFFAGSISVPRPAFALALILFTTLIGLAVQVGRMTAAEISLAPPAQTANGATAEPPARIVYVPVEIAPRRDVTAKNLPAASTTTTTNAAARRPAVTRTTTQRETVAAARNQAQPLESYTVVTATDTNYATKATLVGFKPVENASVRVIKGRGE